MGVGADVGKGAGVAGEAGAGDCFFGQMACVTQRRPSNTADPATMYQVEASCCGHPRPLQAWR